MPAPDQVLVSMSPGETRLALMAADEVVELVVDRGGLATGDAVLGRVVGVNRALDAAFIDIGEARPGFLPGAGKLSEGTAVAVQVAAAARPDKGAALRRAADQPETPAGKPPRRLGGLSPLARLLAGMPALPSVLADDAATLAALRAEFPQAVLDRDCFERLGAAEALDLALDPLVPLADGGRLIIETTAAATVIDIDSGGGAPLAANLAAVPAIARQLRLRAIAGHLLVDAIPLRRRQVLGQVVGALREAVAADPTPTHVMGVTPLGMIELMRERRRPSLAEVMLDPPACRPNPETLALAALRAVLRHADRRPAARPILAAAPAVIAALGRLGAALAETEGRLGRRLELRADPAMERFEVMEG
ncbi:MAG TPA: ribonuclease G [Rhodospirillaceae bacterium]|nr:ribonuclease G [Rhodospirillaceae bacterium]